MYVSLAFIITKTRVIYTPRNERQTAAIWMGRNACGSSRFSRGCVPSIRSHPLGCSGTLPCKVAKRTVVALYHTGCTGCVIYLCDEGPSDAFRFHCARKVGAEL
jgi:hypothetical protein